MGRTVLFCLLTGALLAGAELAAADVIHASSPATPLLLALILLGVGMLVSLGYVSRKLAALVRQRTVTMDHRTAGKPKSSVTNSVGMTT